MYEGANLARGVVRSTARFSSVKNPTPFSGQDCNYRRWRREVYFRTRLMDPKAELQALAILMSLNGRPRDIGLQIEPTRLENADGLNFLLKKLDSYYKKDAVDETFSAWMKLASLKRTEGMSMEEYIVEHDFESSEARSPKVSVPDAVSAYILCGNAGLEPSERALVLTTVGSSVTKTKLASALRRIYGANRDNYDKDVEDVFLVVKQSRKWRKAEQLRSSDVEAGK